MPAASARTIAYHPLKYFDAAAPKGFVFMHDALNQIGHHQHTHWARNSAWAFMPFRRNDRDLRFQYFFSDASETLKFRRIDASKQKPTFYLATTQFATARDALFVAITSGKVRAYVLEGNDRTKELPRDVGQWLDSIDLAFFAGRIRRPNSLYKSSSKRLVFKLVDLNKLLKKTSNQRIFRPLSEEERDEVVSTIDEYASTRKFRYNFSSLWELLKPEFNHHMGRGAFKRLIFDGLSNVNSANKLGRPFKGEHGNFADLTRTLKDEVRKVLPPRPSY